MKERIKQIMDGQHMTQQEFSEFLNIAPATLSSILRGRTRPTLAIVDAIAGRFPDISIDWLLFGKGAMMKPTVPDGMPVNAAAAEGEPQHEAGAGGLGGLFAQPGVSAPRLSQAGELPQDSGGRVKEQVSIVKNIDRQQRRITEIRIFYDDQTWETFVPKK